MLTFSSMTVKTDIFDLENIIIDTACQLGNYKTLIYNISFTNKPGSCLTEGALDNSDVHKLIYTVLPDINIFPPFSSQLLSIMRISKMLQ